MRVILIFKYLTITTMKNLTKGSVVKVTKEQKYHEFEVGDKATIWSQSANGGWYATGEEGATSGWLFEEDMEEVEEEVKYVPEAGDIVRIVSRDGGHYGVLHGLGLVIANHESLKNSVVICVAQTHDHVKSASCVQHIPYKCIEKFGERTKEETNDSKDFKKGDDVWVKGEVVKDGVDNDGDYEVIIKDYGSSTTIYSEPSQLKRR